MGADSFLFWLAAWRDLVSSTPPPTLPSVLGRRSETSRPFREPGCEWVYPAPLARRRPGATRAPGPLSEAREMFGPLIFSQTRYNTGRRPAGVGPSPRPQRRRVRVLAPARSGRFRSAPGRAPPRPPHPTLSRPFWRREDWVLSDPECTAPDQTLWEIRQRRNSPDWLEFVFATYFHSRSTH